MILEKINAPNDIHSIDLKEFPRLAGEIRRFLIKNVSRTGGHLASNLGAVELTLALHNVLQLPEDKIIWDVGHQAYTHKILTGRKEEFATLRKEGGLSGFPKRKESPCDTFDTGHSSNSISAGLGMVAARDLAGEKYHVVSVIGDGALTGGMAYEAMNNAAELKSNFIIILNDNDMSIAPNVGGMSSYLSILRTAEAYTGMKTAVTRSLNRIPGVGTRMVDTVRKTKSSIKQLVIPGMLFENMGLTYLGPVDGHNMRLMMRVINEAKRVEGAVIVHVLTEKGRGYEPALAEPERFHGIGAFDIRTGEVIETSSGSSYTNVFSDTMLELGREEPRLVGITAAMPDGTGLKAFQEAYPNRCYDVGIAEEHAVTFAAGLSLGGMIPVVAIYSSFLQRAVDQILHDVCMQKLHVVFAIDRAGLVGADGETHQGSFDLSYLSMMPGMTVMAPKDGAELRRMLRFAVTELDGPVAVRYPRGEACTAFAGDPAPLVYGKSEILKEGSSIALLAAGSMADVCQKAAGLLEKDGLSATLINVRFIKPMDTGLLDRLSENHRLLVTVEENVLSGGFGQHVCAYLEKEHPEISVCNLGLGDHFVEQGPVGSLLAKEGLSPEKICTAVKEAYAKL